MPFRLRHTAHVLTLALGLLTTTAYADPPRQPAPKVATAPKPPAVRTPAQAKAALTTTAQKAGIPHYVNTNGKVVFNPHDQLHLNAIAPLSQSGNGVLELMLVEGVQHTLGHFEGKFIHFQYINGTGNWRMRPWAERLRPSGRRMFGAQIQLSPVEAANMRARIAGIFAEQGPEHLAGPRWENGKIRDSIGVKYFNCASAWCEMPIGEHGESVAKIIGIPSSGDPFSLARHLEANSNERVFGIGIYGPKQNQFGAIPNQVWTR